MLALTFRGRCEHGSVCPPASCVLVFGAVEIAQRSVGCVLTHEAVVGPAMFLGYNHSLALSGSIPRTMATHLRVLFLACGGRALHDRGDCRPRGAKVSEFAMPLGFRSRPAPSLGRRSDDDVRGVMPPRRW